MFISILDNYGTKPNSFGAAAGRMGVSVRGRGKLAGAPSRWPTAGADAGGLQGAPGWQPAAAGLLAQQGREPDGVGGTAAGSVPSRAARREPALDRHRWLPGAAAIQTVYPRVLHQRCWVHKMRNLLERARQRDDEEMKSGAQASTAPRRRRQAEQPFAPSAAVGSTIMARWCGNWSAICRNCCRSSAFPGICGASCAPPTSSSAVFLEVGRRTRPMVCFVNVKSVERILYSIFQRFNLEWKNRTLGIFTQAA